MEMTTVLFRNFEERDIEFIFKCKNDEKLNRMTVGQNHHFSYDEAEEWVHNCMKRDRPDLLFWAVCTNDEERRIVGWTSLSKIDFNNKSVCQHGIVIADPEYKDGMAMFETLLFTLEYAFTTLKLHRVYGTCLSEHKISPHLLNATGFRMEGRIIDAIYKNGRYYDQLEYGLLEEEYYSMKASGKYEPRFLIKAFMNSIKNK